MTSKNGTTETTIPQPKRLGVGQTPDGLIEIEIQLRKFRLWVSEANVFTRFQLNSLATELLKEMADVDGYESQVRRNMLTEVWAPLFVCSRGEVPTREQFLALPPADMTFWVETAKELRHSFEWLDGLNRVYTSAAEQAAAEKDDVKKKSRVRSHHRRTDAVPAE